MVGVVRKRSILDALCILRAKTCKVRTRGGGKTAPALHTWRISNVSDDIFEAETSRTLIVSLLACQDDEKLVLASTDKLSI